MTAIDLISITIGLTVFFLAERHINRMTKRTWPVMRIVYSMLAVSGLSVAALPWCHANWCGPVAISMLIVSGLSLAACNKRGCNLFGCRTIDELLKRFHELED